MTQVVSPAFLIRSMPVAEIPPRPSLGSAGGKGWGGKQQQAKGKAHKILQINCPHLTQGRGFPQGPVHPPFA